MREAAFQFYATDWLAMFLTFVAFYFLGEQKKVGFIFGMLANIAWLIFAILAGSIATVIANIVLFGLNLRGFLKWKKL